MKFKSDTSAKDYNGICKSEPFKESLRYTKQTFSMKQSVNFTDKRESSGESMNESDFAWILLSSHFGEAFVGEIKR